MSLQRWLANNDRAAGKATGSRKIAASPFLVLCSGIGLLSYLVTIYVIMWMNRKPLGWSDIDELGFVALVWLVSVFFPPFFLAMWSVERLTFTDCANALAVASTSHILFLLNYFWPPLALCHLIFFLVLACTIIWQLSRRPIASIFFGELLGTMSFAISIVPLLDAMPVNHSMAQPTKVTFLIVLIIVVLTSSLLSRLLQRMFTHSVAEPGHPMCTDCGYVLFGTTGERCPECGAAIASILSSDDANAEVQR